MVLETKNGYPEIILVGQCNMAVFPAMANWLKQKLGITFEIQTELEGQIQWKFTYNYTAVVLRYDHENGIALFPAKYHQATEDDRAAFDNLLRILQSL
jgi:hypothetical protein